MIRRLRFGAFLLAFAATPRTLPSLAGELGSAGGWKVAASDGVEARLERAPARAAFRARFDFRGEAGYFSVRRDAPFTLPDNYEISFTLAGDTLPNDLQLKLSDGSGENVWWFRSLATAARSEGRRIAFRKSDLRFAWGPAGGGAIDRPSAIEIALAAGEGGRGWIEIRDLAVRPLSGEAAREPASETPTESFEALARRARRGEYPRSISGEQSYWTIVGIDGGEDNALLGEDGAIEAGRGGFSLEPFVRDGGETLDWSNVAIAQSLEDRDLPIPSVTWSRGSLSLRVTAFAERAGRGVRIVVRYRLRNTGASPRPVRFAIAARPFQVNPPRQFLGSPGGFSPIHAIALDGSVLRVDGRAAVVCTRRPDAFAAGGREDGPPSRWLEGALPRRRSAQDARGFASALLAYDVVLPPGGEWETGCAIPLAGAPPETAGGEFRARQSAVASAWRAALDRVDIRLPAVAGDLPAVLRSSLAAILVNREGVWLHPGPRSYRRAWIRDGATMAEALLRLGHAKEAGDFLDAYADRIYPSGKVPCCVDGRGRDPVPENDSSGEFLSLAARYVRHTGDRAWAARRWAVIDRVVRYLDGLRERPRAAGEGSADAAFCGMVRESISHEGYSSKPVHSFWDDFYALRGFTDAVDLAEWAGKPREARRIAAVRDEFRSDLRDALAASVRLHGIDYVPGSVELGDFDPASTAIAISAAGAEEILPPVELAATFDRYFDEFRNHRSGHLPWDAYTPYEMRVADAFVRLRRGDRARELLSFFLGDRRPVAWNQWPEVVWREARAPNFIGDLPHSWVGAEFILAALDLLAFERESDRALVLAAGVAESWASAPEGVSVRGLSTRWGLLDYDLRAQDGVVAVKIGGAFVPPPGGVVIRWPLRGKLRSASVNGREIPVGEGEVTVRESPADVVLR